MAGQVLKIGGRWDNHYREFPLYEHQHRYTLQ